MRLPREAVCGAYSYLSLIRDDMLDDGLFGGDAVFWAW